jgi:hypothetical protein
LGICILNLLLPFSNPEQTLLNTSSLSLFICEVGLTTVHNPQGCCEA